ncbi:MAG: hypothetical protein ACR2IJ_00840 [Fluviibacter sp.]
MLQLDFLVENRLIFSKASFIRDVVSKAAEAEISRFWKVQEAVKRIEKDHGRK